jgi:sirohydrochlorin cobaltochelatase
MAVILLSHGSVLCGAEQNLLQIAQRLSRRLDEEVEAAFLNYSKPDFLDAFARCAASGATEVTVVPFFLVAGKFVTYDLPAKIEEAAHLHPHVAVRVAAPIGFHEALADAVLHCAERATHPSFWRDASEQTSRFCRDDVRCPLHGSEQCPATSAGERVS